LDGLPESSIVHLQMAGGLEQLLPFGHMHCSPEPTWQLLHISLSFAPYEWGRILTQ